MSACILIVDPDPDKLEAYRASLASKASSWAIETAQSTDQALAFAESQPPDIVVAAMRLDSGNGLKALSRIVDLAPLAHPFIAAADSEKEKLATAFEGGCRYLPEPCPPDRLLLEFKRCLAIDSWLESPVIKELFANRADLACPPPTYARLASLLVSPRASLSEAAEIVADDLTLSAKVLEAANASYHGFSQPISSLSEAISLLGLETLKHIVLVTEVFDRRKYPSELQALANEIWHHSASVALSAKRISLFETQCKQEAEAAYVAGLLHDLGKFVLLDAAPDTYLEAQRLSRNERLLSWQAEHKTFGCDHAEIGAYLLARWSLPDNIVEAVALHHRPANSCRDGFSALAAVHAANAIARRRKNAQHVDATASQEFLAEIGKADRWEDWEAVAVGDSPPSETKTSAAPETDAQPDEAKKLRLKGTARGMTTTEAQAALAMTMQNATRLRSNLSEPQLPHNRGRSTTLAFAAGIVCALSCIYFLSSIGNSSAETPKGEPSAEPERRGPKFDSRQAILQEILLEEPVPNAKAAVETHVSASIEPDREPEPEAEPPPPPPPPPPFPEIKVGAVLLHPSGARAQINGRLLGEGDIVDEAKIVRIERTRIIVEHFGRVRSFRVE